MGLSTRSRVLRYGLAGGAYGLILGASYALRRFWGISFDVTTLIILTMIAAAWYGGRGPGLLVAILFEATLDYYAGVPRNPVKFAVVAFNRVVLFGSVVLFASARRAAEIRLRRQGEELEASLAREREARGEAEAANRLKDDFLATVSHELRTPLNAILGWATVLNRQAVDERLKHQAMGAIERSALAQARIVEDILDFSGVVMGRLRIDPKPVALAPIVADAVETVRLSAEAKAISLQIVPTEDAVIRGDPDRLRQIVWNLLSNAVKFTPPTGRIEVRLERTGRHVQLQVQDTGIGIEQAFLPHVFEPFRQADSSMTRPHGGLGLGLALVRHLAELHGGTIAAESAGAGHGAVFTLRLPLAEATGIDPHDSADRNSGQATAVAL